MAAGYYTRHRPVEDIMEDVISPLHFLRRLGLVGATVIVQAIAQIALTRFMQALPPPRGRRHLDHRRVIYVVAAVLCRGIGLICEDAMWPLLYYSCADLGTLA